MLWMTDAMGKSQFFNQKWKEFTGFDGVGDPGDVWFDALHPDDKKKCLASFQSAFKAKLPFQLEYRLRNYNGEYRWILDTGEPHYDNEGCFFGYIGSSQDISERKTMEDQIHQLAFYDTLTNLSNRRLLDDRLSQAIFASKRSGRYGAVLFLDLDNFKPINDTYGHATGDLLLIEVAKRLKSSVRETDTLARFGGDEFVVMLSELSSDKAEAISQARIVAEKISAVLAEPYWPSVKQEGKENFTVEHHCSASIGVRMFVNHEDAILECADAAMYQAKEAGRNLIRFYDSRN
jgi:diguanylate cyclase (GGDEF)-like protein/PAS domain S-box-containing protein